MKRIALASALAALVLAGTACTRADGEKPAPAQAPAAGASAPSQPVTTAAAAATQTLPDFAAIVEANKGAVVNITATKNAPAQMQGPFGGGQGSDSDDEDADNPFSQFFRHFQGPMPRMPQQGMGSGFIVQADGVVLTNAHVVEGADEVRVKLPDQREFKGKVAGVDRLTDVAVVKIDAKGLPTVKLGDPSKIRVGEWVLAIGSPFGFESTVTAGIVSGTSRSLPEGTYVPFIQTDAAVNPGNSGGPLFNLRGEVIGINSAIYSRTGGYMGVAFAIPIDVAASVEEQLLKTGKVERGRIGVGIQEVSSSLAQSFGLDRPRGALVSTVESDGPADKAGVKPGDVLLSFNGKPIERSNQLPPMVANVKPGTKATMEVWRGGRKETLNVTVAELKTDQQARAQPQGGEHGQLGLAVRPLTPEERQQLNGAQGLVVQQVNGPAARAGIRPGDVITAVNGTPVKTIDELKKLVAKAKNSVALLVRRGDASIFVPIEIG
ncbi:MAG TPA: DegQ family serine endoprotease [Burkholderiales bacterium]